MIDIAHMRIGVFWDHY